MQHTYYRSNCQRCYEEALHNLRKELYRQRCKNKHRQVQEYRYDRSASRGLEPSFPTQTHCGRPDAGDSTHCVLPTNVEGLTKLPVSNTVPGGEGIGVFWHDARVGEQTLSSSSGKNEEFYEDDAQGLESSDGKEEEMDSTSHYSNSQVSVAVVDSSMEDLLHVMDAHQDKKRCQSLAHERENTRHGVCEGKKQDENGFHAAKGDMQHGRKAELKGTGNDEGSNIDSDLAETWQLMDSLRKKISDVQKVVEHHL